MIDLPTPPQPQVHAADFAAFTAAHPAEAALLQSAVTTSVQAVEKDGAGKTSDEKKAEAEALVIEVLRKTYQGADLFLNLHPGVDYIALELLIPLIPKAIDGVVKWLNDIGVFKHAE